LKTKKVIIVTGPTAVGKTAVSVQLASHYQTSIISADSRQCFVELNIGVAKPSGEQLAKVPHYFISSHSVFDQVNASLFEQWSLNWVEEIFVHQDTAIMVGGTGLYIKAFCEGLDAIPEIDPLIRKSILEKFESSGLDWLQQQVKQVDPAYYAAGEIQNPQRLMRALEVHQATGRSIVSYQSKQKKKRAFDIIKIGLQTSRDLLYENINQRVDQMLDAGLAEEVRQLMSLRDLNALQTVGYAELFQYWDGLISLEQAAEMIRRNTRHYAKRQMTWFRKDPSIQWVEPGDWNRIKEITQ
jgi:tRNA dimethylallyltransferase